MKLRDSLYLYKQRPPLEKIKAVLNNNSRHVSGYRDIVFVTYEGVCGGGAAAPGRPAGTAAGSHRLVHLLVQRLQSASQTERGGVEEQATRLEREDEAAAGGEQTAPGRQGARGHGQRVLKLSNQLGSK